MFISSLPSISLPEENLIEFVLDRPYEHYDELKPLFIDSKNTERFHSLASLRDASKHAGRGLGHLFNLQVGDVVALFSSNSIEFPLAIFAAFRAGCTVTLINPVYKKNEVASQLKNSKTKVVLTTKELFPVTIEACSEAGISLECIVVLDEESTKVPYSLASIICVGKEVAAINSQSQRLQPEQLAFLCYSSGTSGLPKAVQLSHKNIIANLLQWDGAETQLGAEDSLISVLPFSHIYALNTLMMNAIRRNMSSYVVAKFDPADFLTMIQTHRITASFIVPPIVKVLLGEDAGKYDLSSLRFLCSGAAPLSARMATELCHRYRIPVSQGYGMTETSPVLCYASFDDTDYAGSIGRLLPNVELKIVGEDGSEQRAGESGELQVRGPNVMKGYLNNEAANIESFTSDGFFKTGDLGYVDSTGAVFVVDRLKELIKYKGFQVPPAELEGILLAHPAIQDCAVIGRQCEREVTELPTAYCVLKSIRPTQDLPLPSGWTDIDQVMTNAEASEISLAKDIMDFVAQKVANFKRLRGGVVFVDAIPRLPAGKILRRMLRDQAGLRVIVG